MDVTNEINPQPKRMFLWKKVAIAIPLTLVGLLLLAFAAAWLLEDKIKQQIVAQVNEQVTVSVQVKGPISFSLLKHFPYASLTFGKVSIDDRLRAGNKKLLNAGEVSFLCNIYSLFGDEIEFSKILMRDGELNLYRDESGKTNFEILKEKKGVKGKLAIKLKKAQVKGVLFTYIDKTQSTNINVKLTDVLFSGNFSDERFELYTKSKIFVNSIMADGEQFLEHRNVSAEVTLNVDKAKKKYEFKQGEIALDETAFSITGFFTSLKSGTEFNFHLLNKGQDIQKLFGLLPEKYKAGFAGADGSGEYAITADVKGIAGKNSQSVVNVSADLKNSELKLGRYNKLLKNVNASAKYERDANGNDKIVISNFNCTLNNLPFNFRLALTNLNDPAFDFYANGVLHLPEIATFIPDSVLQDLEGTITFNNFNLKGSKEIGKEVW